MPCRSIGLLFRNSIQVTTMSIYIYIYIYIYMYSQKNSRRSKFNSMLNYSLHGLSTPCIMSSSPVAQTKKSKCKGQLQRYWYDLNADCDLQIFHDNLDQTAFNHIPTRDAVHESKSTSRKRRAVPEAPGASAYAHARSSQKKKCQSRLSHRIKDVCFPV